jgi:hypothetical protein
MPQIMDIQIRKPCVAGLFYPDDPERLDFTLNQLFESVPENLKTGYSPHAIIVPHAGYIYSGEIAASAYSSILKRVQDIKRVVILGPSHQLALNGAACPSATHFDTPLGRIPLDVEEIARLQAQGLIEINDAAHVREHSIEVQLPFLQHILSDFKIIPIVVGLEQAMPIAALLEPFWRAKDALIVVSSDLSHYLDYYDARKMDSDTSSAIEACRWQDISPTQACGCYPMRGLLQLAQEENSSVSCIDLRNSGDTAGDKSRVVGYGAYVFE